MELKVCIAAKNDGAKYPQYYHTVLDETELLAWAKRYMEDNYLGSYEVTEVVVESIVP